MSPSISSTGADAEAPRSARMTRMPRAAQAGVSALHAASAGGYAQVARALLNAKAEVDRADQVRSMGRRSEV